MLRLVVVLPLVPLREADGFTLAGWPLHLTVAPTFVVQADLDAVVASVEPILAGAPVLRLRVGVDEGFGRAGRIPVSLVEPTAELTALHTRLMEALSRIGAVWDDPDFAGAGFRPHVTMTRLHRAQPGDLLRLVQAAIVDMEPIGAQRLRRVVRAQPLGGRNS
jgi:2'-5' RNA ligase